MDREFADLERKYLLARSRMGLPSLPIMTDWNKVELPNTLNADSSNLLLTGEVSYRRLEDIVFVRGELHFNPPFPPPELSRFEEVSKIKFPKPFSLVSFTCQNIRITNGMEINQGTLLKDGTLVLGANFRDFSFQFSYVTKEV